MSRGPRTVTRGPLWDREGTPSFLPHPLPLGALGSESPPGRGPVPWRRREFRGESGEGWWKLPEAAGIGLGVGRRDTGVGSRLFPTLP